MKTLYFDCFAGASGNMILAGLVSLGVDAGVLKRELLKLNISDFEIEFGQVDRAGIDALHAETKYLEEKTHRHLADIEKIINGSNLSDSVKSRAIKIFTNLARAEAEVHGVSVEKIHFHEVGAVDAIIDVVGACIGFEILEIEKFACSKINVGSGFVKMEHGKYPVPPPAVAQLLKDVPVYSNEIVGELITPTGAAIIRTVCVDFGRIPLMKISKTAYGAGSREYKGFPNVLRMFLGEGETGRRGDREKERRGDGETGRLVLIETNLDDVSPEILGFVLERAFELGCLDCWFTPIQMKKNRPASQISILCNIADREKFTELLYVETTTLGVRIKEIERVCLPRETIRINTDFGEVDVKIARLRGQIINIKPEYDQIREIAVKSNLSIKRVEEIVRRAFNSKSEEK